MKTLRVFGWAVILTVTLLLAACASHTPKVADTDTMSGSDATMTQLDNQLYGHDDSANFISQDWLDERERAVEQREFDVDRRENSLAINQAWLGEHESRLAKSGSLQAKVEASHCYADVLIPAQHRTVAVTKPIQTPKGESLPTLYQTVTEQVKVSDEYVSREEILCETDKTPCRVTEIQRSLHRGGYNPGPIDGVIGQQTMAAINAFQKDFNMTVANELTIETVEALNVHF